MASNWPSRLTHQARRALNTSNGRKKRKLRQQLGLSNGGKPKSRRNRSAEEK